MDNLSIVNSLKSYLGDWLAVLIRKVAQNRVKFFVYLAIILLSSIATSRLLGESFSVHQIKYQGEPKRSVRQATGSGSLLGGVSSSSSSGSSIDPFAARPRIQTQNGHLIIQSSQDKNIDFKTSGARGSITINGFKLDQLIGVARAFEKSHALLQNQSVSGLEEHYELLVRDLFDSTRKLRQLEELNTKTSKQLAALSKQLDKLSSRLSKRTHQLDKLAKEQTTVVVKLKENNCLASDTGERVCKNGATCIDLYDRFKCLCPAEWDGPTCEQDVDECVKFRGTELGCQNGAKCVNSAGSYRCECPPQFHGVHCTEVHDDCTMSSSAAMCAHGKCVQLARTQANEPAYECICDQGWTQGAGSRACIVDINECLAGQNVSLLAGSGAASQQEQQPVGAYPCSQNPFVDCANLPGSFQCGPCPAGYTGNGRLCRDLDECQTNNGGCSTAPLVECINLAGSRRCGPCPPGYSGDGTKCERALGCQAQFNGGCHPMAKCIDVEGVASGDLSRICACQWPFTGSGVGPTGCAPPGASPSAGTGLPMPPAVGGLQTLGESAGPNATGQVSGALGELLAQLSNISVNTAVIQQQDDCQPNPCLNGAQCLLADANFECVCPPKWTGRLCDQLADFACGGRMHTSLGSFEFPVGGSFEQLIKLASGSPAKRLSGEPAAPASSAPKYHCSWSIAITGNMSLRLNFANLTARTKPGTGQKQVQISVFDGQSSRHGVKAPSCREFLDVNERLDAALEAAGARGRRLARLCLIAGANEALKSQSLSLTSDSNMVELEYSFAGERLLDEPALSFRLNWTKTEPSCGGELPVADSGSISSPRFPEFYAPGSECRYLLRVPPGRRIRIQFGELNLLRGGPAASSDLCADSLLILDGALNVGADRPVLFKHCANQLSSRLSQLDASSSSASLARPIISSSSTVELVLVSRADSSTPLMRPKQKRGFILTYASEPSTPGCGGLYTAKAALIRSPDYEKNAANNVASGEPNDEALAYEYARYFEPQQQDNSTNYYASANQGWDHITGRLREYTSAARTDGLKSANSTGGEKNDARRNKSKAGMYRTRCEYEIRPADQARNHRIEIDWLEMPSELSSESMSSLQRWSRRSRCMDSRLMVFDGNPMAGEAHQASESELLLRTFCAGDRFNASLPHARPIASSGHVLYLIYESMSPLPDDQTNAGTSATKRVTGFKLHYSTICSAVYRQLEGNIITELDGDVAECVYHIMLPPNNTISMLVEPLAAATPDASNPAASANAMRSLSLPDGSCAAQAIFIDGVVDRNKLSLAQAERQMRTYDFSGAYFGGPSGEPPTGQADQSAEAAFSFSQSPDFWPASGGADQKTQQTRATGKSQESPEASRTGNSYWQYGTSQVHDIKEFDVCKLPALGIDSVWNHMSLMFRLNPKLRTQTAEEPATGGPKASGRPFERVKVLIKYQAESSCGGVISEPRKGSIKLISTRPISGLASYPLTVGRYEQLHRQLFVNQCAWILRNAPNQLIQLSFSQIPTKEIAERRAAWIAWLRKGRAEKRRPTSPLDDQLKRSATELSDDPTDWPNWLSRQSSEPASQRLARLANCSQAFQEIIELYEPSANVTRFICPTELVDSANFHWTTQSNTVYIRLINNTLAASNTSQSASANKSQHLEAFPDLKPLRGFPPTLNYEMLRTRDTTCGGRLIQSSGMIQSPRFPFNYPANLNCVWLIEAPSASQQLRLNFTKFHLEDSGLCWFDFLEIRNGPSESSPPIGNFCGRELQSRVLVTQSHAIWLKFRSDGHLGRSGFQLFFESAQTGCGGLLSAAAAQIDSPNYPYAYAHAADCEWTLEVSAANRISLEFLDLDLSGTKLPSQRLVDRFGSEQRAKNESKCQTEGLNVDYIEVFEGPSARPAKSLGRFCHLSELANVSRTLHSSSNKMRLVYRSQAQDHGRGFRLKYVTDCTFEQELTGVSGVIESPGFPGDLMSWVKSWGCAWVIRVPLGSNLTVVVTDLSLNGGGLTSSKNSSAYVKDHTSGKRPTEAGETRACLPMFDRLKFWSARVASPNIAIAQQLEPLNKTLVSMFTRNQSLETNRYYTSSKASLGLYNFTLSKILCGQLDDLAPEERQLELAGNVLMINLFNAGHSRELRRFRLEWRARGCGGLKRVLPGDKATEWLHFDERLNLTQRQLDQPLECTWLVDVSRTNQLYEFYLNSNMATSEPTRVLPASGAEVASRADPCEDSSLTLYDGADTKAPVLARNCNERLRDSVYAKSGMILVRYFSSGRLKGIGSSGRAFRLRGWLAGSARESGCSHSIFDIDTAHFQQAGELSSPNYPDQYELKAYRCSSILTSTSSGRIRLTIQDLDIPSEADASDDSPASGLLDAATCQHAGNYLKLRGSSESLHSDFLCGKLERSTGVGVSRGGDGRGTFVLESRAGWVEFMSRGNTRGRWRLTYDRLCGTSVRLFMSSAEELTTPNYPQRPAWPSGIANQSPTRAEDVCVWRISASGSSYGFEESERPPAKVHFNLFDFVESDRLASSPSDCLRIYEGANISLRQSAFNLSELDTKLEPKVKICSLKDLKFNSMQYVSAGSEIVVLISGNAGAHFSVRPFENNCGAYFMQERAEFATPNYPQPFAPNLDCHYFLFGSPGSKISLNFSGFDLGYARATADARSDENCADTAYLEVRQLTAGQRVQLARKQMLKSSLYERATLDALLQLEGASNATLRVNANDTKRARRHRSLERLFQLASLYHVLEEASASAVSWAQSGRVRGRNQQLSINLEEFYANSRLIGRFCGWQPPKIGPNLLNDEILLRFRSHSSTELRLMSTGEKRNPRGFLANYRFIYGGVIEVEPTAPNSADPSEFEDVKLVSSPQYPLSRCLNDSIRWVFKAKPENVLEFELISLRLGSVHEPCRDSLNIYDGLETVGQLQLAKLCGELNYRHLLDRGLVPLWQRSLEGRLSTRKLAVHLAHEPEVRLNLMRRIRTTMNQAVVEYRNFRSSGYFIMRYRALARKASLQNDTEELVNKPLEADEALDESQLQSVSVDGVEEAPATEGASKWCSRVHRLHLKTFGGHTTSWSEANATDRVDLLSPNWPKEVEQRELECHWLVRAQDNTNIRLSIEPSAGSLLAAAEADHWSSSYKSGASARCFKARERNFVEIHDGATNLAPLIGRFCLPAPPIQLQSTGRHLFIRYVHARAPEVGADSKGRSLEKLASGASATGEQEEEPGEQEQRLGRSSLFKATASVGHCGGQYFVTGPTQFRDRPADDDTEWRKSQYENNLDCLYYVFASSLDHVLALYPPTWSEFEFAREPTNADCSLGDFVELRDLPLANDRFDIAPAQANAGRLLGRFCAARPFNETLETPGSGLVIRFHTDAANTGRGFNLFLSSEPPRRGCPRTSFYLTSEEPYVRLLSPNWPLGFAGTRRCKFSLIAPRNYTIELQFVRLERPVDMNFDKAPGSSSEAPTQCLDSLLYLDDNQAHGVQLIDEPLRQARTFAEGTLLRSLVQEVGCMHQGRLSQLRVLRELTAANATGGLYVSKISADLYRKLQEMSPRGPVYSNYTIRTNSRNLLLEYTARNLQEKEGFVAVARIVEMPLERQCGGEVYALPGRNKLESARFGQKMNDSEPWIQCDWSLKGDRSLDYFDSSFSSNLFHIDANDSPRDRDFYTAFLAIQALEVPSRAEKGGASFFEEGWGGTLTVSEKCGLSRVTLSDASDSVQLVSCGYLTDLPLARWRLVGYNLDTVRIRTRNLAYPAPDRAEDPQAGASSTKLHRGLRAFFYESRCPSVERLPGASLRIRSHTEFASNGSLASYQPGICHWMLRLTPGHYELSLRRINLRPESGSGARTNGTDKPGAKAALGCDLEAEQDSLSVHESAYEGAPELARFCADNQQEGAKHKFELNNTGELSIVFVAGLSHLRQGRDKFPDLVDLATMQQDILDGGALASPSASQQQTQYGFELELTRVRNVTQSPFCQRSSSFNIYHLLRNSERYHTYGSDYYGGAIKQNTLYPKNAHCEIDLALDDDLRFNLTFVSFLDLEQSANCRADYVQLLDLLDDDDDDDDDDDADDSSKTATVKPRPVRIPTTGGGAPSTTRAPASVTKRPIYLQKERKFRLKSKQIGRWCGRSLPAGNFVSKSNKIRLVFHSNERIEGKGFLLEWSPIPAPNSTGSV